MQSTSMAINQEALDSQIYNPEVQPSVLMLQQIMETTPYVEPKPALLPLVLPATVAPELREHVETFNNLSKVNPYQGVIVNPAECHISEIREDLTAVTQYMDTTYGQDPNWTAYKNQLAVDIININEDLDAIEDHTDRMSSNLPSLAGIAQAALALSTVMSLLSNPCLGLDGMMGSIMDSGKKLLQDIKNQIKSALNAAKEWVDANIGPLIQDIKDAIEVATKAIADFVEKAKAEIMNFAKAMLAQVRQGLAELMANLPKDPCLRGLLQSAATGAAAAVIS